MKQFVCGLLCFVCFSSISGAASAQAEEEPLEISQSGRDYQNAIRFRRIQTNVAYFDPTRPPPPLDTTEPVPEAQSSDREPWRIGDIDLPLALVMAAILIFILVLFARYGGAAGIVLRKGPQEAARRLREEHEASPFGKSEQTNLGAILSNPQRRPALIALVQLLIGRAVEANGLLLQRSWTARDVLRRLPRELAYLPELKELVMIGERVHFGERPVSEEDFESFVKRAKPLLEALGS